MQEAPAPEPPQAPQSPQASGASRILSTFLGLLLLLALVVKVGMGLLVSEVDGSAKVAEYFGEQPLPFGLQLATAVRLPTQDVLIRLERAPEASANPSAPHAAALIEYRSRSAVESVFHITGPGEDDVSTRLAEWERDPESAWHVTLKKDEFAWGSWRSKLLIERAFLEGGAWRDEARVDLSQQGRALVLFVHWPDKVAADEAQVRELLGAFRMKETEADRKDAKGE